MAIESTGRPSLWEGVRGGTVGAGVLIVLSIALGAAFCGAGLIAAYAAAAIVPSWSYSYTWTGQRPVRPTDELLGSCILLAAIGWAFALVFLWSRGRAKYKHFFYACAATVGIALITIVLCVLAELIFRGAQELIVGGIVLFAAAVTLVMWVQIWRRYGWGRPLRHGDGGIDLRCPQCSYRMVGLKEARCPECGSEYTLDELLSRQNFAVPGSNGSPAPGPLTERETPPRLGAS
jgi:hypothetical protein